MLDDKYFAELGQPSAERIRRLPLWAIRYERDLRSVASWWHDAAKRRPSWGCPVPIDPGDRLNSLPVWMVDWIYTLRFEVWWQREKVQPEVEPVNLLNRPSTNSSTFRKGIHA